MGGRIIAIGDIHGCSIAFETLLTEVRPTSSDQIILLGDIIDRGPDSAGVVQQAIELSHRCSLSLIRGNHEEMLLDSVNDGNNTERWIRNGGAETLMSYGCRKPSEIPPQHLDYLFNSLDYVETDHYIFLHPGYVEDIDLHLQPALALRWRVTNRNCKAHCSGKTVVVGHTAQKSGQILDLGFTKCIDTDCVRGGWLTAIDVGSGVIWQANQLGEFRSKN